MGDASGSGCGPSSWKSVETNVEAVYGSWKAEVTNRSSSNFRETANLVMRLKQMIEKGSFEWGYEAFVFTDNSTTEKTTYRGSLKSKLVHNMVLDLRKMEMIGYIIVRYM